MKRGQGGYVTGDETETTNRQVHFEFYDPLKQTKHINFVRFLMIYQRFKDLGMLTL